MFNPPNSIPDFGPYHDLQKRMIQRLLAAKVDDQILRIMQTKYEEELAQRQVVLSRPERKRLFQRVWKAILTDLLAKLGD
jgi:hypothetical protein